MTMSASRQAPAVKNPPARLLARRAAAALAGLASAGLVAGLLPSPAQAGNSVRLSGPSEFKSWLYEDGKVGAVIDVRIKDPKRRVKKVKLCLDLGGDSTPTCEKKSPRALNWKVKGGWSGQVTLLGWRLSTQSCYQVDQEKPKIAYIVRTFDKSGKRLGKARHVMTETCNTG